MLAMSLARVWGGIPSPILETRTSEPAFHEFVEDLLRVVDDGSLILGVGDMVMSNSLIDRVRYVADRVEGHTPAT
jgi:hypothetical protein